MRKDHFICQRWLAVEKEDGKVKRVFYLVEALLPSLLF